MARFRIYRKGEPFQVNRWKAISDGKPADTVDVPEEQRPAVEARAELERILSDLLQCDHLIVLAGLGTSLSIKDSSQKSLFPTMRDLWDRAKGTAGESFDSICRHVAYKDGNNIEELLSRCIMAKELDNSIVKNGSGTIDIERFIDDTENIIRDGVRKELDSTHTQTHEDFLRRLVRRPTRRPRPCLFTTNYDLCFEEAAGRIRLTVIDGFSFASRSRFQPELFDYDVVTTSTYSKEPDFIPRLLRLFKLHGSVDWQEGADGIEKDLNTSKPLLIYPQSGKYASSYRQPFLEMMSRFQAMLRHRSVGLLAVCCGFNDLHITEPVLSAIKSNTSLRVVIAAPDLCEVDAQVLYGNNGHAGAAATNETLRQIDRLIDDGDNRLTLLNAYFPDLVKMLPMLPVQTEAEHHDTRIRALEAWVAQQKAAPGGGI